MIDFGALVLGPAMAVFGQPITITPTKSQPGQPAYPASGVYALKAVEERIEDTDLFHRTFQHELGIKLDGFSTPPKQGDGIARPPGTPFTYGLLPDGTFEVFDVIIDGQGGATLVLRKTA